MFKMGESFGEKSSKIILRKLLKEGSILPAPILSILNFDYIPFYFAKNLNMKFKPIDKIPPAALNWLRFFSSHTKMGSRRNFIAYNFSNIYS